MKTSSSLERIRGAEHLLVLGAVSIVLSACASTRLADIPQTHPASPAAQEAPVAPRSYDLKPDQATAQTRELLAVQKDKEANPSKSQESESQGHENPMNHGGTQ
jgi:hypothetical protein